MVIINFFSEFFLSSNSLIINCLNSEDQDPFFAF